MRVREVSRVKKGLISALASPRNFNQKMAKLINKHCKMMQISGQMVFTNDERDNEYVQFIPDNTEDLMLTGWRREGVAQRLKNGTFDFIATKRKRSDSILIKKVDHGRLSLTKDGFYQLTLKVPVTENKRNLKFIFRKEAREATEVL